MQEYLVYIRISYRLKLPQYRFVLDKKHYMTKSRVLFTSLSLRALGGSVPALIWKELFDYNREMYEFDQARRSPRGSLGGAASWISCYRR